ncbi:MAG: hypothetical protein QW806_09985 [Nitrososphaerota archaeon]
MISLFTKRSCISVPKDSNSSSIIKINLPPDYNYTIKLPSIYRDGDKLPSTEEIQIPHIDVVDNLHGGIVSSIIDVKNNISFSIIESNDNKSSTPLQLEFGVTKLSTISVSDNYILYPELFNFYYSDTTRSTIKLHNRLAEGLDYLDIIENYFIDLWLEFSKLNLTSFQNIINLRKDLGEKKIQVDTSNLFSLTFSDLLNSNLLPDDLNNIFITSSVTMDQLEKIRIQKFEGSSLYNVVSDLYYKGYNGTYLAICITDIISKYFRSFHDSTVDFLVFSSLLKSTTTEISLPGYIITSNSTDYVIDDFIRSNYISPILISRNSIEELITTISDTTNIPYESIVFKNFDYKFLVTYSYNLNMQLVIIRNKNQKFWLVVKFLTKDQNSIRDFINSITAIIVDLYSRYLTLKFTTPLPRTRVICQGG